MEFGRLAVGLHQIGAAVVNGRPIVCLAYAQFTPPDPTLPTAVASGRAV